MAEGEISFKKALKKFVKTTNFLEGFKKNEFSSENKKNLIEPVQNLEKIPNCDNQTEKVLMESKCLNSDTIELKRISPNNEKLWRQSFQDCDEINHLKSLTITEKNSSVQNFINYASEAAGDNLEFSNEIKTEYFNQKTSEVEQFLVNNVYENIHIDANQHLFDAKVCDTSAQNLNSATKMEYPSSPTKILIKQENIQKQESLRKIFVTNFDEDINTEELYYYFLQFGKIERTINIRKPKARSKYTGFILIFLNSDSVTAAQKSEPHIFNNRTLKLYLPEKDGCEPEEFCKLFVGNLNSRTTENDLRNHFQRWGKTVNCVVEKKSRANILKCYGSVTFKLFSAMNDALVYPHHRIRGRNLKVELFQEREQTLWGTCYKVPSMGYKHVRSTKITSKKECLSEKEMFRKIEECKILKPAVRNYKLNDFDGAGVNIFKHTSISELQSHNLDYISFSLKGT